MFAPGDTFFGGGELHGTNHLWIVINDPAQRDGLALYVNITSIKGGSFDDLTCVLQRGEHAAVSRPSYIRFDGAKASLVAELDEAERRGLIRRGEKAFAQLVTKIRQAALAAELLSENFRKLL